ncbi:MAG: Demethylrebeccamycin-D-glucose O-methyltransferase [Nitrosomonadaceae bacterium]|nr:Demethylrebeccamycin-D-glucose O-methyltransferase [Nitrosomonadaceae bacterium]
MNQQPKVLDLGCGNKKRPGAIGVDFNDRTAADVIHNLNSFPYPFDDSSFDEIYLDNALEHLDDVIRVMEEVYRLCKPGGGR